MRTEYRGEPVAGGTYPAQIWHDFMLGALQTEKLRLEHACAKEQAAREQTAIEQAAKAKNRKQPTPTPPSKHCLEAGLAVDPTTQAAPVTAPGTGTSSTTTPAGSTPSATVERTPPADATAGDGGAPAAPAPAPAAPPAAAPPGPAAPATESGGATPPP
jgi:penicillin-binding protein 1A